MEEASNKDRNRTPAPQKKLVHQSPFQLKLTWPYGGTHTHPLDYEKVDYFSGKSYDVI